MDKIKILAIDDDPGVRDLVITLCQSYFKGGFAIREASNPLDAIEVMANYFPDLIFTDNNMPYLKGAVLAQWLDKHLLHRKATLCFFSSDKVEHEKHHCVLKSEQSDLMAFLEATYLPSGKPLRD